MSGPQKTAEVASPFARLLADPALTVIDGRYYLYPTTDGFAEWGSTSFSAYSSDDLVTWSDEGVVLQLGTQVRWADAHAWAPVMLPRDGAFYLYFSADHNIGVARALSPTGPFEDLGRPLVARGDYSGDAIDPSIFVDQDGTVYLYWGNKVAHVVPLNDDLMSFDPQKVVSFIPTEFCEAAWVHRRGDVYYLTWSVNDTRDAEYLVRYATGPSPFGPWTDHGVLLEMLPERGILGTGHHSVLQVPGTDTWVIAYHRFAIPGGDGFHRETMFDLLVHREDGLLEKVDPARSPLRLPIHHRFDVITKD